MTRAPRELAKLQEINQLRSSVERSIRKLEAEVDTANRTLVRLKAALVRLGDHSIVEQDLNPEGLPVNPVQTRGRKFS
jgi:hypothetical protein